MDSPREEIVTPFQQMAMNYGRSIGSVALYGTPFPCQEKEEVKEWTYFYPHPFFFLLLEENSDEEVVSNIMKIIDEWGYHTVIFGSDTLEADLSDILKHYHPECVLHLMAKELCQDIIQDVADKNLIDRRGKRDYMTRNTWFCGKSVYHFDISLPAKFCGQSMASRNPHDVFSYVHGFSLDMSIFPDFDVSSLAEISSLRTLISQVMNECSISTISTEDDLGYIVLLKSFVKSFWVRCYTKKSSIKKIPNQVFRELLLDNAYRMGAMPHSQASCKRALMVSSKGVRYLRFAYSVFLKEKRPVEPCGCEDKNPTPSTPVLVSDDDV